jgi:hypothetical protein
MSWWKLLYPKRASDEQLNSELRFHIDELTEEYIAAGMSPEEAHRRATLDFGGHENLKEQVRGVSKPTPKKGRPFIMCGFGGFRNPSKLNGSARPVRSGLRIAELAFPSLGAHAARVERACRHQITNSLSVDRSRRE